MHGHTYIKSGILFDVKSRYTTAILTFCVWPLKCHVPAVATALFNLNAPMTFLKTVIRMSA